MPSLFTPFDLKSVTLRNRIAASPMCQYQAVDGFVNDWHRAHYAMLARGGTGLVVVEATAVSPEGRITPGDLGLWSNDHTEGLSEIASSIRAAGAVPGIQIAHAGRKAGCTPPWEGGAPISAGHPQAWTPFAPSAVPFVPGSDYVPHEMSLAEIKQAQDDFAHAVRRAEEAGFDWIELHFAHGFLVRSFLSRTANRRSDAYGGSLENRARFALETIAAVRAVWPESKPLTLRHGVMEFDENPSDSFAETIQVGQWFKEAGVDLIDLSLGLSTPGQDVPWAPNFLVPYAEELRAATGLPVAASWMITDAGAADSFIRDQKIDLLFLARSLLANPHWAYQAARDLVLEKPADVLPVPYAAWLQNWQS